MGRRKKRATRPRKSRTRQKAVAQPKAPAASPSPQAHAGSGRRSGTSLLLLLIGLLAAVFAGFQVYYARQQSVVAGAARTTDADEAVLKLGNTLLAASRMTLPLPRDIEWEVVAAKHTIEKEQEYSSNPFVCRELSALADVLLLNLEQANPALEKLNNEVPGRPLPHLALGISFLAQGKYDLAEAALTEGLTYATVSSDFLAQRARVRLRSREFDAAFRDAERAADSRRTPTAFSHFVLGLVLVEQARHDEAREAFAASLRLMPDWYEPHLALASLEIHQGQWRKALEHVESARSIAPDNTTAQLARAAILYQLGEEADAENSLAKARELLPARYIPDRGYSRLFEFRDDWNILNEFVGEFLLQHRDRHPGTSLEGLELPLLKAFSSAGTASQLLRFEEALFDVCVMPLYHAEAEFAVAQGLRLMNRMPECTFTKVLEGLWMTQSSLRLPPQAIPKRPQPVIKVDEINAFLEENAHRREVPSPGSSAPP